MFNNLCREDASDGCVAKVAEEVDPIRIHHTVSPFRCPLNHARVIINSRNPEARVRSEVKEFATPAAEFDYWLMISKDRKVRAQQLSNTLVAAAKYVLEVRIATFDSGVRASVVVAEGHGPTPPTHQERIAIGFEGLGAELLTERLESPFQRPKACHHGKTMEGSPDRATQGFD